MSRGATNQSGRTLWCCTIAAISIGVLLAGLQCLNAKNTQLGTTSLTGTVLSSDGKVLTGIVVSAESISNNTDGHGHFMLSGVPAGQLVLRIDGTHAGPNHDQDYGYYEVGARAKSGRSTDVGFTSWLTLIDHSHDVVIPSPTTAEVVIRNPALPDFELHIAAGIVVKDYTGHVVTAIGVTPIKPARPPVPIGTASTKPMFFTLQPGAACLYTANGAKGHAQLFLPNQIGDAPRARKVMLNYDPRLGKWLPYGLGRVSADGRQIIPDPKVFITNFVSAECDPSTRSHMDLPTAVQPEVVRP